jgi:hypothetical protein
MEMKRVCSNSVHVHRVILSRLKMRIVKFKSGMGGTFTEMESLLEMRRLKTSMHDTSFEIVVS